MFVPLNKEGQGRDSSEVVDFLNTIELKLV